MSYRNPSDNPGEPPFKDGDYVMCIKHGWSTMRYGRTIQVESTHWNRTKRAWMIMVNHPRFGMSSYNAQFFQLMEKLSMHIALDITNHPRLEPGEIHEALISEATFFAQDKSLALLKNLVKELLEREPTRKIAIFSLALIAEVEEPKLPVRFRDMR